MSRCAETHRAWLERKRRRYFLRCPAKTALRTRLYKYIRFGPECWEWTGVKNKDGYGLARAPDGWPPTAHRVIWWLFVGPIPPSVALMHHCDNRACVRIDHMRECAPVENRMDCVRKRRHSHGDTHGRSKLTEFLVRSLRYGDLALLHGEEAARVCGVSRTAVSWARIRRTWKHVN